MTEHLLFVPVSSVVLFEPRREKTGFLHMRRRRPGNSEADQRLCFHYIGSTNSFSS